nr:reverse transcriptase domain-containing protein [Tanacetum cinerariifolium]
MDDEPMRAADHVVAPTPGSSITIPETVNVFAIKEYVFLEEASFLPVIISSHLSEQNKDKLISVLKRHKKAFAWKTTDILGICPSFFKHKIQLLEDKKSVVQNKED